MAAAANLRRRDVTWATNFFSVAHADYLQGGGNGAAMRIQPHVWAHPVDGDTVTLISRVVTNAVATHGHARGILGAVFHALCLKHALRGGKTPGPDIWEEIVAQLRYVGQLVREDKRLGELWVGQWEMRSGVRFEREVASVAEEMKRDLDLISHIDEGNPSASYIAAANALEAFRADQRGSGTKTAILAAYLSWLFPTDPDTALLVSANCLGTDTDTIASMAGAILGALASRSPDGPISDHDYILHEADRMWAIAAGREVSAFRYPSLVSWTAPKTASDCVGTSSGLVEVAGLGPAESEPEQYGASGGKAPAVWQWLNLWFGQRILAKRRPRPKALPDSQRVGTMPQYVRTPASNSDLRAMPTRSQVPLKDAGQASFDDLGHDVDAVPFRSEGKVEPRGAASIHELTRRAIESDFNPELIGLMFLDLADRENGIEASIGYASILAKARMTRRDRDESGT